MSLDSLLRKTFLFKRIYKPLVLDPRKARQKKEVSELFRKNGVEFLSSFIKAMEGIEWWLEFGTLLGKHRDNDFIKGDNDLDFGAWLIDRDRIHKALIDNDFELVRDYHEIGGCGIERTYAKGRLTLDIFYFYHEDGKILSTGFRYLQKNIPERPSYYGVNRFIWTPFVVEEAEFKGLKVYIPSDAEQHIVDVYGKEWRIPDPCFVDGFNKTKLPFPEKRGMGYFVR